MKIFVSYARNDLDGGELENFLLELERDLKGLTGKKTEILFRDLKDLRLGDHWKPALEDALRTSALMLAVCSSSYFKSDYCGKEYAVFLDRLANVPKSAVGDHRAIFPIIWLPAGEDGAPETIKRFQFAHAALPKLYANGGLRPLFRLSRNRDDALDFVSVLAKQMADALEFPLPEARAIAPLEKITSAFRAAGAVGDRGDSAIANKKTSYARVYVAAGKRQELEEVRTIVGNYDDEGRLWRPFMQESDRTIMADAQIAAGEENLGSEVLNFDHRLYQQIELAEKNNEIVLVLVDPWTMLLPAYARQMQPFDKLYCANCALVVVWNKTDQETTDRLAALEQSLSEIFPNKMSFIPPGHVFSGVEGRNEFLFQLKRAITEAKLRVIQVTSRHRRAEEPALQRQADLAGIDLTAPAILQNASGEQA